MKVEALEQELKLNGLSIFTPKDVARLTGKRLNYIYLILSKSNRFVRIQNGLYCLTNTDPFNIASRIVSPSYISLISAFSYYKLIDQVPYIIKVMINKRHASIDSVMGMRIEFKSIKREMLYGYNNVHNISIADPEKAIVDSLYLLEDTQYVKEAIANANERSMINKGKLLGYAKKCGIRRVYAEIEKLVEK